MIVGNQTSIRVVSAFPGTGKSTLSKTSDKFIDLDSALFNKYGKNKFIAYMDKINEELSKNKDTIILVSTHPQLLELLNKNNIDVLLAYPKDNLKQQYLRRYKQRGDWKEFISQFNEKWDSYMKDLSKVKLTKDSLVVRLAQGAVLADYIHL